MTMPIKFNTLEYVRNLIEAGIPAEQAEAQASALSHALAEATVAPSELVLLRTDMIARIEMLRADIYAKLEALEQRLRAYVDRKLTAVYWMVGISLALQAVQITALVYVISRLP
ncbi:MULTISPECIES: hypothetical protein [unclassified Duganella]|uniref:hypothetical protein n=1 Tax=unclassified Duganella TaxID=2636909 RepID=UPI000890694E|nr:MULTISPECIES: hypothetical protein [unclassified Duganella]SDH25843.1 hypothetical protein SAMN05216320_11197 [Duganella sp. OV458]SDK42376.1 hypothetical protein SAMN05428973_111147 [Duganella sp. OV510]